MGENYVYEVARIRALETSLLKDTDIEQLISLGTYEQCIQFLEEKSWGNSDSKGDGERILAAEEDKIWALIKEFKIDMKHFAVLSIPKLYQDAAKEAYESLVHTGDGQLCDIVIDRACMEAIYLAGHRSKVDIIKDYTESIVAVANIKIAVRAQLTGKSADFMKRAMSSCDSINTDALIKAAIAGKDEIAAYLATTTYRDGVDALKSSQSIFECWCDNRIIRAIKPQKYNAFTVGPIFAYVIARLNEIKTVRIVLTGKQNDLSEEAIRERVREMYA